MWCILLGSWRVSKEGFLECLKRAFDKHLNSKMVSSKCVVSSYQLRPMAFYTKIPQKLHKNYTKIAQKLHKNYTKITQKFWRHFLSCLRFPPRHPGPACRLPAAAGVAAGEGQGAGQGGGLRGPCQADGAAGGRAGGAGRGAWAWGTPTASGRGRPPGWVRHQSVPLAEGAGGGGNAIFQRFLFEPSQSPTSTLPGRWGEEPVVDWHATPLTCLPSDFAPFKVNGPDLFGPSPQEVFGQHLGH